jgi:hypothetical protein
MKFGKVRTTHRRLTLGIPANVLVNRTIRWVITGSLIIETKPDSRCAVVTAGVDNAEGAISFADNTQPTTTVEYDLTLRRR